jgi:hypothetical protein
MKQAAIDIQKTDLDKSSLSSRVYRDSNQLFVIFVIKNDDSTYSACWALGDPTQQPHGNDFESVGNFQTFDEAQATFETMVVMGDEMLLSDLEYQEPTGRSIKSEK